LIPELPALIKKFSINALDPLPAVSLILDGLRREAGEKSGDIFPMISIDIVGKELLHLFLLGQKGRRLGNLLSRQDGGMEY